MQNTRETCMRTTFSFIFGTKADPGPAHRPKKNWGLHAMCTICILFIVLTTKRMLCAMVFQNQPPT